MIIRTAVVAWISISTALMSQPADAATSWPDPSLPPEVRLQSAGEHVSINGMPVHIFQFSSFLPEESLVAAFRSRIERDYTRQPASAEGDSIAAGRVGDFWLTLRLKSLPGGRTRGTWSAAPRFRENAQQRIISPPGFPSGATLIQQIDSFDVDKNSQLAVGSDQAPIRGVADRLESTLREAGFRKDAWPEHSWTGEDRYAAVFIRAREQVVVTLQRQGSGTTIVVNRISALDALK